MGSIRTCKLKEDTIYGVNNKLPVTRSTLYGVNKELYVKRNYVIWGK
jgi:hypothetical protein